jgi:hypothetical protein
MTGRLLMVIRLASIAVVVAAIVTAVPVGNARTPAKVRPAP